MTKEEFVEFHQIDGNAIILEDWDTFSKGIVGVSSDRCHIIYGFSRLVKALADMYTDSEDPESDAIDWLEYNTLRSLDYMDQSYRPIIVIETIEI